jgi:hypothetical protein
MAEKKCAQCNKIKDLDDFYRNRAAKDGRGGYCKICSTANTVSWQRRNRARCIETTKRWCQNNPGRAREQRRRRRLKKVYGLTLEAYNEMQKVGCQICGTKDETLHVDHCHRTGKVRGLLCGICNRGLGFFRDDPAKLRKAATYLET